MPSSKTLAGALVALLTTTGIASAAGELNIYNWGNYISPDMVKKFEQTYDVKVTVTDYDSNDTAISKVRQGGSGFDMAVPSQSYVPIWIQEGLLLETDPGAMENAKNIAPEFANPDFDPGRKYSVPWAWGTVGVSVNTSVLKDPPQSWSLIFDPPEELKGKINVVPEMNDVIHAAIKFNGGKVCDHEKDLMRKVRDTLVNAKPNWVAMEYSTIEKMTAGDYAATSDWNGSAMRQRLQKPEIRYILPKEGFQIWSDNLVVLKEAKNVENAKLFQNFMMDPENAGLNSSFHRYANGIAGSEAFMPPEMKDAPELVLTPEMMERSELMVTCPPEAQAIYTKIWTELQK